MLKMVSLYVNALLYTLQHIVIHAMQLSGVNSPNSTAIYYCFGYYYYYYYYYYIYHLYARYLQLYPSNNPCLYGTQCYSCSVFTICATCDVISPVKCVLYFTSALPAVYMGSAQYDCFL